MHIIFILPLYFTIKSFNILIFCHIHTNFLLHSYSHIYTYKHITNKHSHSDIHIYINTYIHTSTHTHTNTPHIHTNNYIYILIHILCLMHVGIFRTVHSSDIYPYYITQTCHAKMINYVYCKFVRCHSQT